MTPQPPKPESIKTSPNWVVIVGAFFGGIVLIGFFVFAFLAGTGYKSFICDSFQLLAAVFAFGAGLSAAFMGGGAAAQGQLGTAGQRFSFAYGLGGGVAFFVITFVLFSWFPPRCEPPPEKRVTLEFLDVPSHIQFNPHGRFWRKENIFFRDPDVNSAVRELSIRGENELAFGPIEITRDKKVICTIKAHMLTDENQIDAADWKNYALKPVAKLGELISFKFKADWLEKVGGIKEVDPACFKLAWNDRPLYGYIALILNREKLYYADAINGSSEATDSNSMSDVESTRQKRLNFLISPSYAQSTLGTGSKPSFAQLKQLLINDGAEVRVQARRYLEQNFDAYSKDATGDLFAANQDPIYLTSLLHGLIAGIDAATNGALAPGRPRDLSTNLPYVQDHIDDIVRLTAHIDDGVRRQARRLIQRFPMDSFGHVYENIRKVSEEKGCLAVRSSESQAISYGSIFYYYNRIVQLGSQYVAGAPLPADEAKKIEEIANVGFSSAKCLPTDLRIDAESLIFAKAITYSNFKDGKNLARQNANKFIADTSGTSYYLQAHIDSAARLARP